MPYRSLLANLAGLTLAVVIASCAESPVSPAGDATVTRPGAGLPANGAVIANASQPVILTVNNALVVKDDAEVTYTFEVSTDSAFTAILLSKTGIVPGASQTSVTLELLQPGRDYYWRARANGDDTVGLFTTPMKFTIGSTVTLAAPAPVSPLTGSTAPQKPQLTVKNVTRTGPAGKLSYRFEVAATTAFSPILATGTVAEGTTNTSFTPAANLSVDTSYYWRAQALDPANSATGPFSAPQRFTTILSIDLKTVNYQRFVNVSDWPETNRIIGVDQDGGDGHMCINHEKRGLWPTTPFENDPNVPVEATQWYFARINGQWYGGAGEWLRPNQICKDGQKSADIGPDGTWGGPMDTWVPKRGELVGYMITTPARSWPTHSTIDQRSNVVVQPWTVNGVSTP